MHHNRYIMLMVIIKRNLIDEYYRRNDYADER